METSGDHGVRTAHLKVLSPSSVEKLVSAERVSENLARHFDGREKALLVSPFGKVWPADVGRDSDGAFLGRGWPEFAGAHGIGVWWFLVLRHEGGGLLTVKAFDTSFCLKEFCSPSTATFTRSSRNALRKPQFIQVLQSNFMENMLIPDKFIQLYITEAELNSQNAIIFSPLGKCWQMELKKNQSGVFFAGGWSQFLAFHGISEYDVVLLRHEGNMVFKIKVFGPNGCQKDFKQKDINVQQNIEKQQEAPCSIRKRKQSQSPCSNRKRKQQETPCSIRQHNIKTEGLSYKGHKGSKKSICYYEIGPPSWVEKRINNYALQKLLCLPGSFCKSVGFHRACTMTLMAKSPGGRGIQYWQVRGDAYDKSCYLQGGGWKSFCVDNKLKDGDVCTFNVVQATLWQVVIRRA